MNFTILFKALKFRFCRFKVSAALVREAVETIQQNGAHSDAAALLERAVALGNPEACGRLAWALYWGTLIQSWGASCVQATAAS